MMGIGVNRIGRFEWYTKRADEDDPNSEYVSKLSFRNGGKTIFGETPWWQSIEFDKPTSIDDLIEALTYARMRARHWLTVPRDKKEDMVTATFRAGNECKAIRGDDGWKCDCCGEVMQTKYDRPVVCCGCGAFFDEYVDEDQ